MSARLVADLAHPAGGSEPGQAVAHCPGRAPERLGDRGRTHGVGALRVDVPKDEAVELPGTQPLRLRASRVAALVRVADRPAVGQPATPVTTTRMAPNDAATLECGQRLADRRATQTGI
jgi:hypothetical protein